MCRWWSLVVAQIVSKLKFDLFLARSDKKKTINFLLIYRMQTTKQLVDIDDPKEIIWTPL
jgi:hypothetical protein